MLIIQGAYLHFRGLELLPLPGVPGKTPPGHVAAVLVRSVEQGVPAVVEPPAGLPLLGTVGLAPDVVVAICRGEHPVVVPLHGVVGAAAVAGNVQLVAVALTWQADVVAGGQAGQASVD